MDGYVKREEFMQELILRERIRDLAKEAYKTRNVKQKRQTLEESKLRRLVRKLVLEAAEEAAPHENTGINVIKRVTKGGARTNG